MTRDDAGYHIRASGSKISRMELGRFPSRNATSPTFSSTTASPTRPNGRSWSSYREANATPWYQKFQDVVPDRGRRRELRGEAGITVDPALLGEPIETAPIEFWWGRFHFLQDQTFYAIAVRDAAVSFAARRRWNGRRSTSTGGCTPRIWAGRRRAAGRPGAAAADAGWRPPRSSGRPRSLGKRRHRHIGRLLGVQ